MNLLFTFLFAIHTAFCGTNDLLTQQIRDMQKSSTVPEIELGIGNGAKTEVIMYFSPTCVHCAEYDLKILPDIIREYIKTNKIRMKLRPLAAQGNIDILAVQLAWNGGKQKGAAYDPKIYLENMKVLLKHQNNWLRIFDFHSREGYEKQLAKDIDRVAKKINNTAQNLRAELNIIDADIEGYLKIFALEKLGMSVEDVKHAMHDEAVEHHTLGYTLGATKDDGKPLDFTPAFYINGKLQDNVLTLKNLQEAVSA